MIMLELRKTGDKENIVKPFLNDRIKTVEEAIEQAKYIVAEKISDQADYRKYIRDKALKYGTISSKKKKNDLDIEEKYKNYYDCSEPIAYIKPHRILALNRAEKEDVITVSVELQPERDILYLTDRVTHKKSSLFQEEIQSAVEDAYKRLIAPSIQREIRNILSQKAEEQAIAVFSLNLRQLLLQPPLKGKVVLGVDPAFRTGCKLAVLSKESKVLEIGVIYPNEKSKGSSVDAKTLEQSKKTLLHLISTYQVEVIAIGNGTASRETEWFIANVIQENKLPVQYVVVSEAGASVYSASFLAKEEFPDLSVEQRSAISIGRRIQDPLLNWSKSIRNRSASVNINTMLRKINYPNL